MAHIARADEATHVSLEEEGGQSLEEDGGPSRRDAGAGNSGSKYDCGDSCVGIELHQAIVTPLFVVRINDPEGEWAEWLGTSKTQKSLGSMLGTGGIVMLEMR